MGQRSDALTNPASAADNHTAAILLRLASAEVEEKMMPEKIEYRVRMVPRYFVTRYHETDRTAGSETRGEYDNADVAHEVAYALCKAEHDRLGWHPGDERIQYPRPYEEDQSYRSTLVSA